jgi:hypothetical protein
VAHGQQITSEFAERGRAGAGPSGSSNAPRRLSPDEIELNRQRDVLDKLGREPPKVNVARNDAEFGDEGAHTLDRHGPDIPLPRDPNTKTIEGRIFGDNPWRRENSSFKWTDGYFNKGMYGAGPRQAQLWSTSLVKIRLRLVDGSDPPQPFILTAFPPALG